MNLNIIGENIKHFRKQQHLLQKELAEKAGVCKNYISQIERGNKRPSMEAFINITNALGVSADTILSELIENHCSVDTSLLNDKLSELSINDQKFIYCIVEQFVDKLKNK